MMRAAHAGKATAFAVALLGAALLGGMGLANYAESGAFSFYKERQRVQRDDRLADLRSEPAAAPLAAYSSTAEYRGWAATPAPIEYPPAADAATEDSYDGASEDGGDLSPDFEQSAPEPQTVPPPSQATELPSPRDGPDTEGSTVSPDMGSAGLAAASEPVGESAEPSY